jgi:circadian clock protein KaiB
MQKPTSDISDMNTAHLRLYIARSTPNSTRAEHNLKAALSCIDNTAKRLALEIIDVFSEPKRAISDGVIVTPTLIGLKDRQRLTMMGDLSDSGKLKLLLEDLTA